MRRAPSEQSIRLDFPGRVGSRRSPRPKASRIRHGPTFHAGFTVLEILIAVAIIGTLASIAIPLYNGVKMRAHVTRAVSDIRTLQSDISGFELERGRIPNTLAEINRADLKDPWDRPYEYLSFAAVGSSWKGQARKDKSLVPINSTFDLYSRGKDGDTNAALTANASFDDIIRANDGGYVGLGKDY
jgi:general secretion pathway protein G